ncbi:MAG: ABC transporter permease [Aristaeellaceae bacterium]
MTAIPSTPPKPTLAQRFKHTAKQYWKYRYLMMLLIPSVVVLIIFKYVPMYGVTIAFKDFKLRQGILGSPWVGFKVFEKVFSMPVFWTAFKNTAILGVMNLLVGFPLPILLALLLNEIHNERYKKVLQTISYLPHFVSWITLSGLFIQLLSPSTGPVASLFRLFGAEPYYFMGEVSTFRWVLVATNAWKGVGWGSIVYLAALSGVDQEMYEAALIDGANRFQRVWYITLPSILPTVTIMLILRAGSILADNFDQIYNMSNSAMYEVANVLGVYTYELGLKNMRYAESTAVSLFLNVISLGLVLLTNYVSTRVNDYGIW